MVLRSDTRAQTETFWPAVELLVAFVAGGHIALWSAPAGDPNAWLVWVLVGVLFCAFEAGRAGLSKVVADGLR